MLLQLIEVRLALRVSARHLRRGRSLDNTLQGKIFQQLSIVIQYLFNRLPRLLLDESSKIASEISAHNYIGVAAKPRNNPPLSVISLI